MKPLFSPALLISVSIVPISAAAQAPTANSPVTGLTVEEFTALLEKEFTETDADKNGKVSPAEIAAFRQARQVQQAQQANAARFAKLDKDGNGWLDRQEFAALTPNASKFNGAPLVARLDKNKDGFLSRDEYRTGSLADFERLDTDRNGRLSPVEARANRKGPAKD